MSKLIFDNRAVGALFVFLLVVNAFAIQNGWYALRTLAGPHTHA